VIADYEVRIAGRLDATSLLALQDLDVTVTSDGPLTVVSGRLDQPALHGLLERIRVFDLRLEEVRRVRVLPSRPG
jgi:hypothetical protein